MPSPYHPHIFAGCLLHVGFREPLEKSLEDLWLKDISATKGKPHGIYMKTDMEAWFMHRLCMS